MARLEIGLRLVALYPESPGGGGTVATHLGCGASEEYSGPLIWDDADAGRVAALALDHARGLADVLEIYALDPASPLAARLHNVGGIRYRNVVYSPVITLAGFVDFDTWLATKSKSFRQGLRYDRNRLAKHGALEFSRAANVHDGTELAMWLFENKRGWLAERQITESWILKSQGVCLFTRLLARADIGNPDKGDVHGFSLKFDGRIIAACICFRSHDLLEYFMTGFDPEFAAYSPGSLLLEDCVRYAISEALDFDFRVTHESYKLRWCDRFDPYETHVLARTWRGAVRPLRLEISRCIRRLRSAAKSVMARYPTSKNRTVVLPRS